MKKRSSSLLITILCLAIVITGCTSSGTKSQSETVTGKAISDSVVISNETRLLIQDLKDMGDYVNSREFPSLIKASIVHESLGSNIHVIDIRPVAKFAQGHIKGAVNKKFEDMPAYFEKGIKPFEFEKIILACDDGQVSGYTASLLRLKGYGNVYSMRWGMSAWNRKFAESGWLSGFSSKYEAKLEKTINEKPVPTGMPELNTGMTTGADISAARFMSVFSDGTGNVMITADEIFSDPEKYFVINFERKDKYDDAHIPGAVRYKPNETLGFIKEMATIPANKTVVVYCGTGHNSAFATAYLRLLGYDARTLKYGNNGFMYDWMKKDKAKLSWLPFAESDINDFEVVK